MKAADERASRPPAHFPAATVPGGVLGWLPWIAAALAALTAGFLIEVYFANRTEIAILTDQYALARIESKGLQQRLEAQRILSSRRIADLSVATDGLYDLAECDFVPLRPPAGGGSPPAMVVWDPRRQQGTLVASGLPPPATGREFRLWIIDGQSPAPRAASAVAAETADGEYRLTFKSDRVVRGIPGFRLTLELAGPAAGPGGPVVLSGP